MALFSKLQARYGHKWSSAYPSEELVRIAIEEWSIGLSGVTGEQIRKGIDVWEGEWPPTLSEFKSACVGVVPGLSHNTAAYKFTKRQLPKPKADPEIVAAELAKMRTKQRGTGL